MVTEENAAENLNIVRECINEYSTKQIKYCLEQGEYFKKTSEIWCPSEELTLDFFRAELKKREKLSEQNYREN